MCDMIFKDYSIYLGSMLQKNGSHLKKKLNVVFADIEGRWIRKKKKCMWFQTQLFQQTVGKQIPK